MNINSNFLIILVGLPASGKSTFAFKLKELLKSNFPQKVKIIDPDLLRDEMFPSSFNFKNEPIIREKNIQLVEEHLSRRILETISEVGKLDDTDGTGIAFQIDVEDAVGVAHQVNELVDRVEDKL